jgi:hypothetical protein
MASRTKHDPSLYRAIHSLRHGGLHRALGIPEEDKIPESKIESASHSDNAHLAHMANFAKTMGGFHHGGK